MQGCPSTLKKLNNSNPPISGVQPCSFTLSFVGGFLLCRSFYA